MVITAWLDKGVKQCLKFFSGRYLCWYLLLFCAVRGSLAGSSLLAQQGSDVRHTEQDPNRAEATAAARGRASGCRRKCYYPNIQPHPPRIKISLLKKQREQKVLTSTFSTSTILSQYDDSSILKQLAKDCESRLHLDTQHRTDGSSLQELSCVWCFVFCVL